MKVEQNLINELQEVIKKYKKYNGQNSVTGGMYYGSAPVGSFQFGGLELVQNQIVMDYNFPRKLIIGLKVGTNWFPFPKEAERDSVSRSKYFLEKKQIREQLKEDVRVIFKRLVQQSDKLLLLSIEGSAYSLYFVAIKN